MTTDLTGVIPHGWQGGETVTKWWRGKFLHLYRLRKPCAQCGMEMSIDVTKAAIIGTAKNAGLHLVRCAGCRQKDPRDITSRPTTRPVIGQGRNPAVEPAYEPPEDVEPIPDVTAELETFKVRERMYIQSVQVLQARVATLEAKLAERPAEKPFDPHAALAADIAKKKTQKMPWEA